MTFKMRYICEKANPKNITAYGYTLALGGLGTFDSSKYQENTGELPPDAAMAPPTPQSQPYTETTPAQPNIATMTPAQLSAYLATLQAQVTAVQAALAKGTVSGLLGK